MHKQTLKLFHYFRSSASHRVRIALAIKGIAYRCEAIHLLKGGGQQRSTSYLRVNPAQLVPSLETERGVLTQSLAIIEYLEELQPQPSLLPADSWGRAQVRAFALSLCCDCQPLVNLRVQQYLREQNFPEEKIKQWLTHWLRAALGSAETVLAEGQRQAGIQLYCFTDEPGMADVVLIPQMLSALRFGVDITLYPHLYEVYQYCSALPVFIEAAPENQPDAE